MTWVGLVAIAIILLGALAGWKAGAIREFVKFLGLIAVIILAYQFKDFVGSFLIKYMPFFNFAGTNEGIYASNFLFYQTLAFVVVFLLLYCILNILVNISGMVEIAIKLVSIMKLPSKITGAILGALEATVYVFIISFVTLTVPTTQKYIMNDSIARRIVERTPILTPVFCMSIVTGEYQHEIAVNNVKNKNDEQANMDLIMKLISYSVVDSNLVQEQIDSGKLHLQNNVKVASA